jgi:hypothetical protein
VSPNTSEWRELARTAGDGVEVALLRSKSQNRAKVVVSDRHVCRHLDFELAASDAASAFERPLRDVVALLSPTHGGTNEGANA